MLVSDHAAPRELGARRDFPLYRALTPAQWLAVLAFCAAGFAALTLPALAGAGVVGRWLSVLLFAVLPLMGLRLVAGRAWITLLAPPRARDLWIGLAFVPVVVVASFGAAFVVRSIAPTSANKTGATMAAMSPPELAGFLAGTLPQLFGEELVTIIPFLAVLGICHMRFGMARRAALAVAWVVSALIFGALHLPTYEWHVLQALGIIGVARLALTLAYTTTKSIWASTIAHVANDWMLFAVPFVFRS